MKPGASGDQRNFDDLADKFLTKVYGGLKGRIRLAVLAQDFEQFCPRALGGAGQDPMAVLDAGCGHAPFSLGMAEKGHTLSLCDISEKMLAAAQMAVAQKGLAHRVHFYHCPIQDILPSKKRFDLVLCHGVLGWVAGAEALTAHLTDLLNPGGILSLTFYNLDGMIFKNLVRGNYKKILNRAYRGWPGSLTPTWPRKPGEVMAWLADRKLDILCQSGIRVFHDYNLDPATRDKKPDTVVELELAFSRQTPFRDLGRYQHVMALKKIS